jgi:hypothetical protein
MWARRGVAAAIVTAMTLVGAPALGQVDDDTTTLLDGNAGTNKRTQALDRLWSEVEAGRIDRATGRETVKQILWKGSAPSPLRVRAFEKLISDTTPEGQADTRNFVRLRLPTEAQWPVIEAMCKHIVAEAATERAGAWRQVAPALVRSYARKVPTPPDSDRPERDALLALFPDQSIERVVFEIYLDPEMKSAGEVKVAADVVDKQRQAAWELLGRLDSDGSRRREFLTSAPADQPAVSTLARLANELRVVPVTGSELAWANGLIDSPDPGAAGWWASVRDAAARLNAEQAAGLQLRHLEALRWATANRSQWVSADRDGLLAELKARLDPRRKWRKSEGVGPNDLQSPELLSDWADRLSWGDVLTILVIDEALKDARVVKALFEQAAADRVDTSGEHGGLLFATDAAPMVLGTGGAIKPKWDAATGEPGFIARGYAGRPAQRVNDRTFVAPDDMFTAEGAGGRALAHYHFHAQSVNNADYAGPGYGDHEYAALHGRACLVFTSVRPGVMNVDYYQRPGRTPPDAKFLPPGNGVQIDLGEVESGR